MADKQLPVTVALWVYDERGTLWLRMGNILDHYVTDILLDSAPCSCLDNRVEISYK